MAPKPVIFERGDKLYLVAPVSPFTPESNEIEEFAFADQLKKLAPNENLLWLQGRYVEADSPNDNGQQWSSGELAIKSMTPMLMPVTVMHDPRTAVGTIADVRLRTPDADGVPRARIDTSMAIWKHRFPEVAEEVAVNYEQGSLQQSMECVAPDYECASCGQFYQKLPGGAERKNWCTHLSGGGEKAARILRNVVFTGTGLIFGTRGARGAFRDASLDVFQAEVAEFHEKQHRDTKRSRPRRTRHMEPIEISREEYAELQKRPTQDALDSEKARADEAETKAKEAESAKEAAEIAQKEAETKATEAETKLTEAEETANQAKLSKERVGKLGTGFTKKLPESVKTKLDEQAKSLTDEEWTARLTELAELTGVKPDEGGAPSDETEGKGSEFSREEVAGSGFGSGGSGSDGNGAEPSVAARRSVVAGLVGKRTPAKTE